MTKRYAKVSMPMEAWNNFNKRYAAINLDALKLTRKRLPKTNFFIALSMKPVWFEEDEIVALAKNKKIRRNGKYG